VNRAGCSQERPAISLPMECKQYSNECSKVNVDVVRLGVNYLFKCRDSKHCYLCSRSPKNHGQCPRDFFLKKPLPTTETRAMTAGFGALSLLAWRKKKKTAAMTV
jgi:hypothetical protein